MHTVVTLIASHLVAAFVGYFLCSQYNAKIVQETKAELAELEDKLRQLSK